MQHKNVLFHEVKDHSQTGRRVNATNIKHVVFGRVEPPYLMM